MNRLEMRIKMISLRILISLFLGLTVTLSGCAKISQVLVPKQQSVACPSIPLGIIIGTQDSLESQEQREGYELALAEINDSGGVQGCPLDLIFSESDSGDANPDRVQSGVLDLADQNVVMILGATSNAASKRAASISEYIQTPVLVVSDTADDIVDAGNRWTFRINPSNQAYAEAAFETVKSRLGVMSAVAILYEKTEYGESVAVTAGKAAMGLGLNIVSYQSYLTSATDFLPLLQAISSKNPSTLYLISSDSGQIETILETIRNKELPLDTIIGNGPGFLSHRFLYQSDGSLNPDLENLMFTTAWSPDLPWMETSEFPQAILNFRKNNENPSPYPPAVRTAQAYTALHLAAKTIQTTTSRTPKQWTDLLNDPEQVTSYRTELADTLRTLRGEDNQTILGPLEFSPAGQNSAEGIVVKISGGQIITIFPERYTSQASQGDTPEEQTGEVP